MNERRRARLRASGWHLLLSVFIAVGVAVLVYGLWYPGAYVRMAGGTGLLLTIIAVDVVVGPLLTCLIFDIRKPRHYLVFDIIVIALMQAGALAYGMHSVFLARPVALVYEGDRFRVISAADVVLEELPNAPEGFQVLSLTGPQLMAVRKSQSLEELTSSVNMAVIDGVDTSQRPSYWTAYGDDERKTALSRALPLSKLTTHYAGQSALIHAAVLDLGLEPMLAKYLPVRAKNDSVAVLDSAGNPTLFLPYDPFVVK